MSASDPARRLRVLLVEDDDVDRMRVHRAVKRGSLPLELVDATSVAEARKAVLAGRLDCAVIDFNLPDGTAFDVLEMLAEDTERHLPAVVLTGDDDEQRALEVLARGAEDYLVKSRFEVDAFRRSLRYAVERARMRAELAVTNARLQRELEVGGSIQTSILPRALAVPGLDIAARMEPATEVGGDYYDVLPFEGGVWLGIGDVAGHGMQAAIVALMAQASISSLTTRQPNATPATIVATLNDVLYDNIRQRLQHDEHMTLTLLRYEDVGRVTFAGAHEEILVKRQDGCEAIMTPGTWLGARRDIRGVTEDAELTLGAGDVMVLYSDGITEAMNPAGEQLGLERLRDRVAAHSGDSAQSLLDDIWALVHAWTGGAAEHDDDLTMLIVRRQP